jgi:hypothetical protein
MRDKIRGYEERIRRMEENHAVSWDEVKTKMQAFLEMLHVHEQILRSPEIE